MTRLLTGESTVAKYPEPAPDRSVNTAPGPISFFVLLVPFILTALLAWLLTVV